MTPRLKWMLAVGCTSVALGSVALVPVWRSSLDATASQPLATSAPVAPAQQPAVATPPSAAGAPQPPQPPQLTAELRAETQRALASDNAGDRIEAVRAVRDRHAIELLPELLALDPARDPDLAPTLISACADLANQAEATPQQRTAAASRLATWLQTESRREGADARGNESVLIEALGRLNTPESVAALSGALESDRLPVHLGTLAAEGLARIGDPSARPAVVRFRDRLAAQPAADSFSRELRSEALASADRALASWR
jgi:hypothetical protein